MYFTWTEAGEIEPTQLPDGLLNGYGIFTTMAIAPDTPLRWPERHWARLMRDSAFFQLRCPWQSEAAFVAMLEAFRGRHIQASQVLRISLVGNPFLGAAEPGRVPTTPFLSLRPLPSGATKPVALRTVGYDRPFATHKHMSYLQEGYFWQQARQAGFNDILRCNARGEIAESAYANVFWIGHDDTLFTPDPDPVGCLPGLMRQAVLDAALELGLATEAGCYGPDHLKTAKGLFITNAVRGLVPVARVDDHSWNPEGIAPILASLQEAIGPT